MPPALLLLMPGKVTLECAGDHTSETEDPLVKAWKMAGIFRS